MNRLNSLLSAGVKLTSTGTAVASPIPFDSSGYFPRFVRVVASGAGCYVKVGDIGVTAVSGDCMVQPLDGVVLNVAGCKAISAISVSGTSSVTVVPLERGSWNYDQRTLDYDFTTLSAVPSPVTATRGSGGGYFGSDGLYKWQGYNLLTYSGDLTQGGWTAFNATLATGETGPTGLPDAQKIVEAANTNQHAYFRQNTTLTAGATYTVAAVVKQAGRTWAKVSTFGAGTWGGTDRYAFVNLATGEAGTIVGATGVTVADAGNGYWLVAFQAIATTGGATGGMWVLAASSDTVDNYAGDITKGVLVQRTGIYPGTFTAAQIQDVGGLILTTTAANSAPRLDYDPATLLPRGLLVEEQRTNSETNSVTPIALKVGDTVASATGPDGLSSAWLLTADGASGAHGFYQAVVTPVALNTYTVSVFLKAGTQSIVQLATGSAHSGATVYCNYNLSLNTRSAGAGIVSGSDFMTSIGGGWYRCGFSYVSSAAASGAAVPTYAVSTLAAVRGEVTTLATTYYRFGGQYESTTGLGSATFPTSYIPTTTASATRSADSVSMTGTNFSSWYNQTQGTFVVEGDLLQTPSSAARYVNVAGTGVLDAYIATSRVFQAKVNATFPATANSATVGANFKMAVAYDATGNSVVGNGGTVGGDASFPSANTALWIGSAGAGSNFANSHIRRIQYCPTRLPNATLQTLTA